MTSLIEALLVGAFAAISVVYTFQTRIPYPVWIVQAYDKPWIFVLLFCLAIVIGSWSMKISVMTILLLCALWLDGVIFLRNYDEDKSKPMMEGVGTNSSKDLEVWPYDEPSVARTSDVISGPPLQGVPLPEPHYPVFHGLNDEVQIGPAPF